MVRTSAQSRVAVERRPATAADTPLLRELYADSRPELTVLPMDSRLVLVDMQFRAQRRRHATQFPDHEQHVLTARGADVGQVLVDRRPGELHILDIVVDLGHRRQGIAAAVLAELVDEALIRNERIWTSFWAGNTGAFRLFEGAGFAVVDEADGHLTMARR
jgi:ribosomal protein S18 acetylase RimI-like enzyme